MSPERTIGETLRGAREERGLSQESLSQGTRISLSVISQLESDRFESLPGGLYTRNFIRILAEYLELEAEPLLARLGGREKVAAGHAARPERSVESREGIDVWREESVTITRFRDKRWRRWPWALALLIVAVAAFVIWKSGWFAPGSATPGGDGQGGSGEVIPAADEHLSIDGGGTVAVTSAGGEQIDRPAPADDRAAIISFGGPLAPAGDEEAAAAAPDQAAWAVPAQLLEIQALGECRVSLTVDGKGHFGRRFLKGGGRWRIEGDEHFLLSATDAGRLRIRLDGEDYPLPDLGREPLVALRVSRADH